MENRGGTGVQNGTTGRIKRSIEVEYWVVDEDGHLTAPGDLVNATPGAEREFVEPLLEVKTTPCETTAELRTELLQRLRAVLERASEQGMGLVPLATPLSDESVAELPSERTRVQNVVVGKPFEAVRHCAGTHIHVEQLPGRAVDQLNTFIALDPALALLNSSPYYAGEFLAAGARSELYRRRAYAGLANQGRLWRYVDDRGEWDRRLERRYEAFRRRAIEAGIDRRTVAAHFDPESAIWTPVQLREAFGTVEWRSADVTLPSQVVRLADRLATIVEHLQDVPVRIEGDRGGVTDGEIVLPEFATVLDHVDAAIDDGLGSNHLRAYLQRMGFEVDAYEPLTDSLVGREPISREDACELRLRYARRLERDISRAASATSD